MFTEELEKVKLPFDITKIIPAKNKLTAVSKGCLLYSNNLENDK